MNLTFDKARWNEDGDGFWLSIRTPNRRDAIGFIESLKDKKYAAELKEQRKKRSLDANAYCWVLIGKLAAVLRTSPDDVYRRAIRDVGGNYEIFPIKNEAVGRWKEIWEGKGIGWPCEVLGPSKLDGYTNTMNFYGSSVYDTAQMARLIDAIVGECKVQGVETMTPMELEHLKEEWHG